MGGTAPQPEARTSLTAEDWANAALDAIVDGGMEALAVEPLARRLGVTKGSFYWHFQNREALLRAALARWERKETDDVLARIGETADPYERLVKSFMAVNSSYRAGRQYLAIAAAEDHPIVSEFVRRVSQRRMEHLVDCYRALGFADHAARDWARFAYATFMGNLQIRRDTPELMPTGEAFTEYLHLMIKTLIPQETGQGATSGGDAHPHVVPLRRPGT